MSQNVSAKVASHSFINMIGNGTRVLLSFATSIAASRLLGAKDFGYVNLIFSYVVFMHYILTLGFDNSLTYYIARYLTDRDFQKCKEVLKTALVMSLAAGLLFSVIGTFLAPLWLAEANLLFLLLPTLLFIYQTKLWAVGHVIAGFLRGTKEFLPMIVKEQFLFPALHFFCLLIFVSEMPGVLAYTASYTAGTLACLAYMIYHMYKVVRRPEWQQAAARPLLKIPKSDVREWVSFSLPLGIMSGLEPLVIWMSVMVAGSFLQPEELGHLSVCMRATLFSQFLLLALSPIFAPFMAELYKREDRVGFADLFQTVTYWSTKWALLLSFFMAVCAEKLLSIFGAEYSAAALCLILILPGSLLEACCGTIKQSLLMSGYNRINVVNVVIAIALNAGFGYLLIPRFGLNGAAAAFSIAFLTLNFIRIVEFYIFLKIKPFNARMTRNVLLLTTILLGLSALLIKIPLPENSRFLLTLTLTGLGLIVVYWKDREVFLGQLAKRKKA